MKKIMRQSVFFFTLILICLICTACGSSSGKVPDSYIIKYLQDEELSDMSFSSKHHYDSKSHIDTVSVTLTKEGLYGSYGSYVELKYQYDRSSDLWTLFDASEFEDATYSFNKNLIGYWDCGEYDSEKICLNITAVDSESITLDGTAVLTQFRPFYGNFDVPMSASGTYSLENATYIYINMDVPEEYRQICNRDYYEVGVRFDIDKGIASAFIAD